MSALALLMLALVQSPQTASLEGEGLMTPQQATETTGRPAAPYSLPPVSTQPRDGEVTRLVPEGTPGPVEVKITSLDDSVPLPNAAVYRETPQGDVVEQGPSGDPYFLGFAARAHYPPAGELVDGELYANALPVYPDGRPAPETYAFVMFSQRMTESRLQQLEALGCRLLGFHPHYTQKVAIPSTAIDAVAALPFVRWVGVPKQDQKVHPVLMSQLGSAPQNEPMDLWVSVYESDVGPASVRRTVPGPMDTDPSGAMVPGEPVELKNVWYTNGWQQQALEAVGLEVIDFAERANAFRVRGMPEGLELVTALDFVQFVEPDSPAELMHDESMPMVNADDARNFYTGGSSLRTITGIVDSGVENSHWDLNHIFGTGTNLSGSATGTWDDDCGHGSHVAGTILGSGDGLDDHTGVAEGLGFDATHRFFNVRIFSTCAPQSVDEAAVIGWMSGVHGTTERPHVINNSWGTNGNSGSPWVGTETECQLYDNNAYSDAQLNVFAAGNDGSAAGTIGKQAASKNVLAVGNVVDYNSGTVGLPSNTWSTSSRGPTGDNRWKPNVNAVGRMVTSVDAATTSGYTDKWGTSMAAPHVTGIASLLIDSFDGAAFVYLPERISAQLMATAHTKNHQTLSTPSDSHLDQYGTGRVDATRAIWGSGGADTHWAFSLGSGGATTADFTVPSGATRLVAVMHYVETAASSGASQALVNDWDFYLDQPPIDPAGNTGEWFVQQSTIDNTEIRILSNPTSGTWRWKIWPDSTSSTAYFGVSVYVQTTDASPALSPSLVKSDTYVQPFDLVNMDYNLATPGGSISGVFLNGSASSGAVLSASRTYLKDGVVTNLLDNQHSGWDVTLGNIDPFYSRDAEWDLYWTTEGSKSFCVQTNSDNASNSPLTNCASVIVDGTVPGLVTNLVSTSHVAGVWSNDPTISYAWTAAVDPFSGGTASGIDGYGIFETNGGPSIPGTTKDLGAVTSYTSPAHASSTSTRWFNIRAVDRSANWGSTASTGGYLIDTTFPSTVTGLTSSSHTVGVLSCNTFISGSWQAASDAHSGIAGYGVSANSSPTAAAPTTVNIGGTSVGFGGSTGTWYLHVRSIDNAGNASPTVHMGPFYLNSNPVTTYCTAKVNSQGCTPQIGTNNAPSYSGGTFEVIAKNVVNSKSGLLFWGYGSSATPFQGGTKCVANPVRRTPIQNSGGTTPPAADCSGLYSFQFTKAYMASKGVGPGDTLYAQYWSRDPQASFTIGLTDAVRFTVCQ